MAELSTSEIARLYGSITALRFLVEELMSLTIVKLPNWEGAARQLEDACRSLALKFDPGADPDMAYAIVQACDEEIGRTFESIRTRTAEMKAALAAQTPRSAGSGE